MARRLLTLVVTIAISAACGRAKSTPPESVARTTPQQGASPPNPSTVQVYMCPMDKDIRSYGPGNCPRCGMKLVTSIPDPVEYHMDLTVSPPPVPGHTVHLAFDVFDPWKGNPVTKFAVVHEKLFHAFIVSRDLQFFVHDHPEWKGGAFHYDLA